MKFLFPDVDVSVTLNQSNLVDDSLHQIVPPCNRETKVVSGVYDLPQIIGEEELAAMAEEVQKSLEDPDYTNS